MAPSKKKQPKNAFYFFMLDIQEEYARNGRRISLAEISNTLGGRWKELSDGERAVYESRANECKNAQRSTMKGKLAADGTSILENMREEQETLAQKESLKKQIQNMIMELKEYGSTEAISSEKFYIGCFNIMCKTEDNYFPSELGLVEYSLNEGICRTFHKFIDPGPIPTGYTFAAKSHSENTHQIPLPCAENAEKNYQQLYDEVLEFISPESQVQPNTPSFVFCLQKDMEQNRGCFEWLHYKAGRRDEINLVVCDLAVLLVEVRAQVDKPYPSYSLASEDLQKNTFDYTPDTRCDFHENLDSVYCSLGYSKRLCYLFSDSACGFYDVVVTEKHLPKRVDVNTPVEILREPFMNYGDDFNQKKRTYFVQENKFGFDVSDLSLSENNDKVKSSSVRSVSPEISKSTTPESSSTHSLASSSEMRQPRSTSVAHKLTLLNMQKNAALLTQGIGIGRGRMPTVPSSSVKPGPG